MTEIGYDVSEVRYTLQKLSEAIGELDALRSRLRAEGEADGVAREYFRALDLSASTLATVSGTITRALAEQSDAIRSTLEHLIETEDAAADDAKALLELLETIPEVTPPQPTGMPARAVGFGQRELG